MTPPGGMLCVNRRHARVETRGDVAQLGERRLCKPEAVGSIPIISTTRRRSPRATAANTYEFVLRTVKGVHPFFDS